MTSDEEVLSRLGRALAPAPATPSATELAALREATAQLRAEGPRVAALPRRSAMRSLVAAAAAASVALLGLWVWSEGPSLTSPEVRSPQAQTVGLVAAQEALDELEAAIQTGNPVAVRQARTVLEERMAALDPDDVARIEEEVTAVLVEAEEVAGPSANPWTPPSKAPPSVPGTGPTSSTVTTSTTTGDGTVVTPPTPTTEPEDETTVPTTPEEPTTTTTTEPPVIDPPTTTTTTLPELPTTTTTTLRELPTTTTTLDPIDVEPPPNDGDDDQGDGDGGGGGGGGQAGLPVEEPVADR